MAVKIFPTVNDVGGGGAGKVISEANLVNLIRQFLRQNFVLTGFTVPASSTNLTLSVAAGEANISGYRVVIDTATTITCTASATNYIYLNLTRDASGNVTGAIFTVNTTGTATAYSILIATAVTDANTVTSTTDKRILYPFSYSQLPYTPVNKAGDTISGNLTVSNNAGDLKIVGTDHVYIEYYPRGIVNGRKAYVGYSSANSTVFNIGQQDSGNVNVIVPTGYNFTVNSYKVWHAGNMGAGSGLDADMVRGIDVINPRTSGSASVSTNQPVTITHNFGYIPKVVLGTDPAYYHPYVQSISTTTLTISLDSNGAASTVTAYYYLW